jgi:hypothetical protein
MKAERDEKTKPESGHYKQDFHRLTSPFRPSMNRLEDSHPYQSRQNTRRRPRSIVPRAEPPPDGEDRLGIDNPDQEEPGMPAHGPDD